MFWRLNNKPSTSCHWFQCFGTQPRHQTPGTMPWSTQSFWGQITCPLLFSIALYFLPMVPMLWHSAETPNPGTMAWSAHGLVRPDSRRQNLIFLTNRNILHTLKNEPLKIMLLHTSRTMDGPWIKMVPVVSRIFYVSSSTGLGIEGYLTCWKDELGNNTLGTKAQNMH